MRSRSGWDFCTLCGGRVDRRGRYCQECYRAMGPKSINVKHVADVSSSDVSTVQKRRCIACRDLGECLLVSGISEGCIQVSKVSTATNGAKVGGT
jgi:hypothetical protein